MNATLKVQAHHLERGAYLYIRQSSIRTSHRKRQAQAPIWPSRPCHRPRVAATIRSSSSTAIRADPARPRRGCRASSTWCPMLAWDGAGIVGHRYPASPETMPTGISANLRLGGHTHPRRGWRVTISQLQRSPFAWSESAMSEAELHDQADCAAASPAKVRRGEYRAIPAG